MDQPKVSRPFEDKELISMFVDGIKQCIDVIKPSPIIILHINGKLFLEGIDRAAKAANGMAHTQHNTTWLLVRDTLEKIKQGFVAAAAQNVVSMGYRNQMTILLSKVLARGQQVAFAKAMQRQQVLVNLDRRKDQETVKRNLKLVE